MGTFNKIFKTAEIHAIDQYTIEHEPVSALDLMERAGSAWTEFFLKKSRENAEVRVLAGNGNNGGDGYVIARLLKGVRRKVVVFRLAGEMSEDCRINYGRWIDTGGEVCEITAASDFVAGKDTVIIDALFGSGLNRPVGGLAKEVIGKVNSSGCKIFAVDIPSGLMGEDNSGNDPEAIVRAHYTFTFQFPKLAFMLPENACYVGDWQVVDIGLHPEILARTPADWFYTTATEVRKILPGVGKSDHKGTNGKGLLVAGAYGMMGAAVLAAKAAVRSGVGVLHTHVPSKGGVSLQTAVPESILDIDYAEECFSGITGVKKYDAVAVGPAIGQRPETVEALKKLLQTWRGITIIDADALNILAAHREMLGLLHDKCLLTPHIKEFERLAGKSANDFDRLNKLSTFVSQYQVYVILKGAYSVVATPQGQFYFNMSGNPGMAKGGAGDVLTGVLLGLAANGLEVRDIARIGVYAHGLCGDLLVGEYGHRGISAGMLAEGMGKAWKELEMLNE